MTAPLQLLRLQQLFDSQFPVGAFAHSGGLETYAARPEFGRAELNELLRTQIELGWGRLDLAAACLAWRANGDPDALAGLCAEVEAWKMIPGQKLASVRIGRRTLALAARLFPETSDLKLRPPHQPVVAGELARRLGLPGRESLLMFAQSTLAASLAAATRAMALSPEQSQEAQISLQPALIEAVDRVTASPEESMFAATPALDVRAFQQTHLHTRLFQS